MTFTAQQIADFLQGEVVGNPDVSVQSFSKIEEGTPGTLSFLANPKYTPYIYDTHADIVLVNNDFVPDKPIKATLVKVPNAYAALATLMQIVSQNQPKKTGIHHSSMISDSAHIGKDVYIGAYAVIEDNVEIGDNSSIYPQVYIGNNVKIGNNVTIYPGAKIYHDCVIGDNCILHAGVVIGGDGFGFSQEDGIYNKIPQLGNVVIEPNVEIGANSTVDRAVMGSTIIREGVKLDNLIQIAHNCEIGKNTVMAAQTGIAGSTKIGENCVFAGQVGIGGHISIENDVKIGAQSGIISNIKSGSEIMGSPAYPLKKYLKTSIVLPKLPDLYKEIEVLKKEIEKLKSH